MFTPCILATLHSLCDTGTSLLVYTVLHMDPQHHPTWGCSRSSHHPVEQKPESLAQDWLDDWSDDEIFIPTICGHAAGDGHSGLPANTSTLQGHSSLMLSADPTMGRDVVSVCDSPFGDHTTANLFGGHTPTTLFINHTTANPFGEHAPANSFGDHAPANGTHGNSAGNSSYEADEVSVLSSQSPLEGMV